MMNSIKRILTRFPFLTMLLILGIVTIACKFLFPDQPAPELQPPPTMIQTTALAVPTVVVLTHVVPPSNPAEVSTETSPEEQPGAPDLTSPPSSTGLRPWPDTRQGISVFNDQLSTTMTEAQMRFAATHYAGTQKMTRIDADRLRAINPDFIIIHYRLGLALGYRAIQGNCQPTGEWLNLVDGDWKQEWPGDAAVQESWFYHWPENGRQRVLNCDWGWYLGELNDPGWRNFWHDIVLRQVQTNDDDGVFMDSLSVPNYLGATRFSPHLPEIDAAFESAWSNRIRDWLVWLKGQPLGKYALIPNAGNFIVSRDTTDYSPADGVMIEGFAMEADASPYNLEDWRLQMNQALRLITQDKIILAQNYVNGNQERMFSLGSYLLIKGRHTYLNIDLGEEPEWWPEYDIPIGTPLQEPSADISALYDSGHKVYRRDFDNGLVLVNPTNPWDDSKVDVSIDLGGTYYLAQAKGGGVVPEDGKPTGEVSYQAVERVTLPPSSAAVLLKQHP
jgi:hypothetical protein